MTDLLAGLSTAHLKFATTLAEKNRGGKTTNPDALGLADNVTQLGPRPTKSPF